MYIAENKHVELDLGSSQFKTLLYKASDLIEELYSNLENKKVFCGKEAEEVEKLFHEDLPGEGKDLNELLEEVKSKIIPNSTLSISPNFFAYVTSCGTYAGIIAELLYGALNQNCSKWHCAPAASEIEKVVVDWIGKFIGYPGHGGSLTSGGSAANMSCLAASRKAKAPFDIANDGLKYGPQLTYYASTETHSCVDKSIDSLGIGKKNLRKIPVNKDFRINTEELEKQIVKDKSNGLYPICVIGNAGTVNTGAIDPLDKLAEICKKYNLWFHVDAAYGGPAASTDIAKHLFNGLEYADSVALDPHKWLYVPIEAGCALVKDIKTLREMFSILPNYLKLDIEKSHRFEFMEHTFQLSRSFKALKLWMTFKAYGADKLKKSIEDNIKVMRYLGELISKSEDFELLAPVTLSTVCFRYKTKELPLSKDEQYLSKLNKRLLELAEKDGRVFITGTMIADNEVALRACSVNHRTKKKHVENLINVLRELAEKAHFSLTREQLLH